MSKRTRLTTEQFIEKAKAIHGNKYDYSKVNYITNNIKVCIICPIHGEFLQTPRAHLEGKGCKKCANDAVGDRIRLTTEEFIEKAKKVHGDKYDYSKADLLNRKNGKVCIICPTHGEFWQEVNGHLQGKGCRKCSKRYTITTQEFIERAKQVHGNRYDYSKVNYIDTTHKVCIICPIHGEFWQKPNHHLNGQGCKQCYIEEEKKKKSLTTKEFIERAKQIHGDKYDYSKVEYVNGETPVIIICPKHGEFLQQPRKHLIGHNCPICNESKLEEQTRILLTNKSINFESQKKFKWLGRKSLDFYMPEHKIAIECQGKQHFIEENFFGGKEGLIEMKKRDKEKAELCKNNGISLIYYNYNEKIEKLDKRLEDTIKRLSTRD